jgi:hypothetical protein
MPLECAAKLRDAGFSADTVRTGYLAGIHQPPKRRGISIAFSFVWQSGLFYVTEHNKHRPIRWAGRAFIGCTAGAHDRGGVQLPHQYPFHTGANLPHLFYPANPNTKKPRFVWMAMRRIKAFSLLRLITESQILLIWRKCLGDAWFGESKPCCQITAPLPKIRLCIVSTNHVAMQAENKLLGTWRANPDTETYAVFSGQNFVRLEVR